jgi:hypothetical protein
VATYLLSCAVMTSYRSVGIGMGCELDGRGSIPMQGQEIFLYSTVSRLVLGYQGPFPGEGCKAIGV